LFPKNHCFLNFCDNKCRSQKKYKLAKSTLKRALKIAEAKFGKEHPYTADIVYEIGCFYLLKPEELGANSNKKAWSADKAEEWFSKALKIAESALGENHPDVARVCNRLGSFQWNFTHEL
jgi:hypothetical protein